MFIYAMLRQNLITKEQQMKMKSLDITMKLNILHKIIRHCFGSPLKLND